MFCRSALDYVNRSRRQGCPFRGVLKQVCRKVNFSQCLVILTFHYVSETELLLDIDVIVLKDLNIVGRFEIC